jgi:hypothetical protein
VPGIKVAPAILPSLFSRTSFFFADTQLEVLGSLFTDCGKQEVILSQRFLVGSWYKYQQDATHQISTT